jgi:hypothetical protein
MFDEATARALAIIITALGGPALLVSFGRTIWKWWTGRTARERGRNNDLVAKAKAAEARADEEATLKRKAMEYASLLRRQLLEAGTTPHPWPEGLSTRPHRAPKKEK